MRLFSVSVAALTSCLHWVSSSIFSLSRTAPWFSVESLAFINCVLLDSSGSLSGLSYVAGSLRGSARYASTSADGMLSFFSPSPSLLSSLSSVLEEEDWKSGGGLRREAASWSRVLISATLSHDSLSLAWCNGICSTSFSMRKVDSNSAYWPWLAVVSWTCPLLAAYQLYVDPQLISNWLFFCVQVMVCLL